MMAERYLLIGKAVTRNGMTCWDIYQKDYLNRESSERRTKAKSIWDEREINYQNGATEIKSLFTKSRIFDYSKPVFLLRRIFEMFDLKDDAIILDFRAGKKISEDLKRQEFSHKGKIAVSQTFLSGEKIKERPGYIENPKIIEIEDTWRHPRTDEEYKSIMKSLDIGFRCLRLDGSNMQHVYYTPDMVEQQNLFSQVDNVKPDRTSEDLLFQVMLDLGLLLSSSIETKEIAGKKVFNVAEGFLLACFDHDITDETVKAIAQMKPHYAVFRDSSMANDSVAANFEQIFKAYSPDTVRKVL